MADYTAILAAIDAAILAGAATPLTLSVAGKSTTYRTLTELIAARKHFVALQAAAGDIRDGIKIAHFKKGGAY